MTDARGTIGCMTSTTALVTGANKGIGKEIARQLVSAGFTVYLGSRDAARGRAAAEEIGGDCHLVELDVTDEKSIAAAAASIASLDVLINNAGVLVDSDTGPDASLSSFRATYETNVFGVVAVTNAFLPALRRSPAPRIVNISSGTASLGASTDEAVRASATGAPAVLSPGAVSYRSSKAALNMITALYAQALPGSGSTRWPPACAPPTSTAGPAVSATTRPRPPREPCAWPGSTTTARPEPSSAGTFR